MTPKTLPSCRPLTHVHRALYHLKGMWLVRWEGHGLWAPLHRLIQARELPGSMKEVGTKLDSKPTQSWHMVISNYTMGSQMFGFPSVSKIIRLNHPKLPFLLVKWWNKSKFAIFIGQNSQILAISRDSNEYKTIWVTDFSKQEHWGKNSISNR